METIDRAHLAAQTFGDADLAAELLGLFADQCRRILPRLADPALPAQDRADLAHTLKGSAASVGASHVRDLSSAAETALRGGGDGAAAVADLEPVVAACLAEIG
ncbi:histidine kinase [Methylobacterium sp. WL12]|uniref:Hpt domain-containing protein n=2 Tax=unclassified Methylobacterium TaxID=2615210 RepID=UPI0011CCC046|nr:Hpt domain-containing protein [Methylobacterium sp. WL12]TXM75161.1 histidine kinase [Methylobacterium sp. WL12]